jgi:hypothetical protein
VLTPPQLAGQAFQLTFHWLPQAVWAHTVQGTLLQTPFVWQ